MQNKGPGIRMKFFWTEINQCVLFDNTDFAICLEDQAC